jgi:hypothetical protein
VTSVDWLTILENQLKQDLLPSLQELKGLLALCGHPLPGVREKALLLLLHPPVWNEVAYYRWLIPQVLGHTAKIGDLPEELIDNVCDIFAFLDGVPASSSLSGLFARAIKHLPERSVHRLFGKAYAVRPFVPHLGARFFKGHKHGFPVGAKRRFRILAKLLTQQVTHDPCCELTMADLQLIRASRAKGKNSRWSKGCGRWRMVGRTLLLPSGERSFAASRNPTPVIRGAGAFLPTGKAGWLHQGGYIPGLSKSASLFMEKLLLLQANELASVRDLARQVSQKTRRVVLSLHNASLAAAGGWAFECLARQFPSVTLWRTFRRRVQCRLQTWQAQGQKDEAIIKQLADLWEQRLLQPKLAHALWESRIRALFDDSKAAVYAEHLEKCRELLEPALFAQIVRGEKYGWHSAVSPHQRLDMDEILRRRGRHKKHWRNGLLLLVAMIQEGQRLLEEDRLASLVLPWIDKFFISSRREEDLLFLPSLVNWITSQDHKPLILFWEDSSHAQAPSFQLVLDKLKRRSFSPQGIGVFDSQGSRRSDALQVICDEHLEKVLFALRPCSDVHHPKSFFQLLNEHDHQFFAHYDSAWKDDIAFIYAGTQVVSLLSVRCEMEIFPSWVAAAGRKYPFGCWFRQVLRAMTLGENCEPRDFFSIWFSRWANLC